MNEEVENLINKYIYLSQIVDHLRASMYAQSETRNGTILDSPIYPAEFSKLAEELEQRNRDLQSVYEELVKKTTFSSVRLAEDFAREMKKSKKLPYSVCEKEEDGVFYLCVSKGADKDSKLTDTDLVVDVSENEFDRQNTRCILFNTKTVKKKQIKLQNFLDEKTARLFNPKEEENKPASFGE